MAFTAAIQPGPSQAYILSRVTAVGWRRTLSAAFAPLISDGPIAVLALLVLGQLSDSLQSLLRIGGGTLLLYFALRTFQQWRKNETKAELPASGAPRTLAEATLVQFLNPNPYLGWALILGPIVLDAWRESPSGSVALVAAFYVTMVGTLMATIYAFGTARLLSDRIQRALLLVSTIILVLLSLYQFYEGGRVFLG